jgi:hypothetical protein
MTSASDSTALTPINDDTALDSFDAAAGDPTASPINGPNCRFDANLDQYVTGKEKTPFGIDQQFVVIGRNEGWQFLKKDCQPEWLMRPIGGSKPPQPVVDKAAWPLGFNNQPEHPWKWTYFLYLLDTNNGAVATFSTSTIDGGIGIRELQEQITFMRKQMKKPGAVPIIELESVLMQTQYGSKKPRPHFAIKAWKDMGGGESPKAIEAKPAFDDKVSDLPF